MYKLSDKEITYIRIKCSLPLSWLALRNASHNEITGSLVKRAYAAVSCRNPLLRAVYKPEIDKSSLIIRDVRDVIRDEAAGTLPAHLTTKYHTRAEAWADYKRMVEDEMWTTDAMWEVTVCPLGSEPPSGENVVVFAHFNHGVADGAAVMEALGEFVRVLNAGLLANSAAVLPPHDFLGESRPVPKPFLERFPHFRFDDPTSEPEKEELFEEVIATMSDQATRLHAAIVDRPFTEEATRNFIAKCKAHGVSVTAGLYAAVAMAAAAPKTFKSSMPISYRTKGHFGDLAVSFTSSFFDLDLSGIWKEAAAAAGNGGDKDALWETLAKVFHKTIHTKLDSEDEKYRGTAFGFIRAALEKHEAGEAPLCPGQRGDVFSICLSNVGILDKYFAGEEEDGGLPLSVVDVTGYCSNHVSPTLVLWCFTLHGKFHMAILDSTYAHKRELLEKFTSKVFRFVEGKN